MRVESVKRKEGQWDRLAETMGTVPAGIDRCRRGLSPLDQLPIAPLGTGPVGTGGFQQVQSPMALIPHEFPITGMDSSHSPMALAVNF